MRTILLVDDDDGIRGALRASLEGYGLVVEEASEGAEAIEKADTLKASLAILVTDVVMPKMSGIQLVHILRKKHIELPVVFMSGYAAGEEVHQLFKRAKFLQKPFSRAELINAVCSGLGTCPNAAPKKACVMSCCETVIRTENVSFDSREGLHRMTTPPSSSAEAPSVKRLT